MRTKPPLPIFDSKKHIDENRDFSYLSDAYSLTDINTALSFLKSYQGSVGTFISYRREIERFMHWCAIYAKKSLNQIGRAEIERFIKFVQKPPKAWIGASKPPKFGWIDISAGICHSLVFVA